MKLTRSVSEVQSWLVSITMHVVMFLIMAIALRGCGTVSGSVGPKAGNSDSREIGLHRGDSPVGDNGGSDGGGDADVAESLPKDAQAADQVPFQPNAQPLLGDESTINSLLSRPRDSSLPIIGRGPSDSLRSGSPTPYSSGDLLKSSGSGGGTGTGRGGKAGRGNGSGSGSGGVGDGEGFGETTFFDIQAKGIRFMYVVDRSGSMYDHGAIRVAKEELVVSLAALEQTQQFQVIFYNQKLLELTGNDDRPQMHWATDINRTFARQFISNIQPDGGTDHLPALKKALRFQTDHLFFLTDADQPVLSARELNEIKTLNGGRTKIHCVEFGKGPELNSDNFLKKLARDNGGTYRYRDVTRFGGR